MLSIDTSSSLRIAVLMEMLEEVSRAKDAEGAFRAYARRIRRVRPIDAFARISIAGLGPGEYRVVRSHRARGGLWETPGGAPFVEWAEAPVRTGGVVATLTARREPQLYQEMNLGSDPVLGDLTDGMGSCMCVPMFENGRPSGWTLMFRTDPHGYALGDLEDDLLIANLFGTMMLNLAAVEQISALNKRLKDQFDEVARVQDALLPKTVPRILGVTFAASYLKSGQAGGDYYDFFDLGAGRVGLLIADVSGHGPAAATVMAMLHAMLHARPDVFESPAAAMRFANARLVESATEGGHVTAVFGVLDAPGHRLTIARAGHPLPRLRTVDGTVRDIGGGAGEGAAPMGIVADGYAPRESTIGLERGQTVVLYTDGVPEAPNARGEQLGIPGLDKAIRASGGEPPDVIDGVRAAVVAHCGGMPRTDDQTVVAFRVEG